VSTGFVNEGDATPSEAHSRRRRQEK